SARPRRHSSGRCEHGRTVDRPADRAGDDGSCRAARRTWVCLGIIAAKEALLMATDTIPKKSWVQKTPGVCGGDACIRNTRITVWGLVERRNLGASDAEMLDTITGLMREDLEAAWEYYDQHREEIDQAIRENEEA